MTLRNSPSLSPSTSFQASLSPNIQVILNKTMTTVGNALRNSLPNHNTTVEGLNMALGDPNSSQIPDIKSDQLYAIVSFIIVASIIGGIVFILGDKAITVLALKVNKNKLQIPSPMGWIKKLYNEYSTKQILPTVRLKKAKESPFVSSMPTPPMLPTCPRLEGAEKGQNIMFRFRGPANARIESSNTSLNDNETRITIVAVVEGHNRPPLPPKNNVTPV
jgi:hypothetical protein